MASIQELHQLIHSLSKYEKSQLSIHITALPGKAKERYRMDYNCFAKQAVFDKEALKAELNTIEARKNLSEANTNLYNFILTTLVNVNQSKLTAIAVMKELQAIEMLSNKGLIEQANSLLAKTKRQCEDLGSDALMLKLMEMEQQVILKASKTSSFHIGQIDLIDQQAKHIDSMGFKLRFKKLRLRIFNLGNEIGTPRNQSQLDRYLAFADDEVLSINPQKIAKEMLQEFYLAKVLLYAVTQPKNLTLILGLVKEGLGRVDEVFDRSVNVLPKFLLTRLGLEMAITANQDQYVDGWLGAYQKLAPFINTDARQALYTSKLHWAHLLRCLNTKQVEKGMDYVLLHEASITNSNSETLSPQLYINYLLCARICFLAKDFERSLMFVEMLLARKKTVRRSLMSHVYCLYLLNHRNLGNNEYLPYATRSFYRSILAAGEMYEPEKALLYFLKKSVNTLDLKDEMKRLHIKLVPLAADSFNNSFFGNGDYIAWLEQEIDRG